MGIEEVEWEKKKEKVGEGGGGEWSREEKLRVVSQFRRPFRESAPFRYLVLPGGMSCWS